MITQEHVNALPGRTVYDRHGDKIGTVGQIWTEGPGGQPAWASVRTGLFGMNESLLPLMEATLQDDRLLVPYDKSHVTDAPNIDVDADEPLSPGDVDLLYEHYHLSYTGYQAGVSHTEAAYADDETRTAGRGYEEEYTGRRDLDEEHARQRGFGDDAMTRSEEQLNVDTRAEEAGRARLRKYVVTENVQATVPVQHEEARLEREPITDVNRGSAYSGADLTESEHEVTLHAERPVVGKETVPVEQVRLGKETVTDETTVSDELRKERIEADLPDQERRRLG